MKSDLTSEIKRAAHLTHYPTYMPLSVIFWSARCRKLNSKINSAFGVRVAPPPIALGKADSLAPRTSDINRRPRD